MRTLQRLTISAALAAAALAAAAVPAVAASAAPGATYPVASPTTTQDTGPAGPQYSVLAYVYGYLSVCYSGGGTIYTVNADGIHIRNAPDGAWLYSIQKNRWWDDIFNVAGYSGTFTCISYSAPGGQYWVPGFANYAQFEQGWIGANYLN